MNWNAFTILVVLALLLAVASLIRPTWGPLNGIALVFVCVALLVRAS